METFTANSDGWHKSSGHVRLAVTTNKSSKTNSFAFSFGSESVANNQQSAPAVSCCLTKEIGSIVLFTWYINYRRPQQTKAWLKPSNIPATPGCLLCSCSLLSNGSVAKRFAREKTRGGSTPEIEAWTSQNRAKQRLIRGRNIYMCILSAAAKNTFYFSATNIRGRILKKDGKHP